MKRPAKYYLNVYWNDVKISDFDTLGDDPEFIYKEYSNGLLRTGIERGMKLPAQKQQLIDFCDTIAKRKSDCYKIKCEEHFMFLSAFFALHKLNYKPTYDSYIFVKKKRRSKKVNKEK